MFAILLIENCIEEVIVGCTDCRKKGVVSNHYKEIKIIKNATCGGKACSPQKQLCPIVDCDPEAKPEICTCSVICPARWPIVVERR